MKNKISCGKCKEGLTIDTCLEHTCKTWKVFLVNPTFTYLETFFLIMLISITTIMFKDGDISWWGQYILVIVGAVLIILLSRCLMYFVSKIK